MEQMGSVPPDYTDALDKHYLAVEGTIRHIESDDTSPTAIIVINGLAKSYHELRTAIEKRRHRGS